MKTPRAFFLLVAALLVGACTSNDPSRCNPGASCMCPSGLTGLCLANSTCECTPPDTGVVPPTDVAADTQTTGDSAQDAGADAQSPADVVADTQTPADVAQPMDVRTPSDVMSFFDVPGDAPNDVVVDVSNDVPPPPIGPVQCRANSDCRTGMCNRNAPGGICLGCGSDTDCGAGFTCAFAACVRDCTTDADCNAGFRCDSLGRCAIRSCPCPSPYVCDTGTSRCVRPTCAGGAACPAFLTCNAGVCVEP